MAGARYHYGGERTERIQRNLNKLRDHNRLNQFADLISGGDDEAKALTPRQAAERMGKPPEYGNALMQRLRKRMGRQAI